MTETPTPAEPVTGPVDTAPPPHVPPAYVPPPVAKPKRRSLLTSVAAWVGIVAGSVFVVAVIFFSGFILGAHSGGDHGHDRREAMMFKHRGEPSFPMGPTGQFERGPFVFRGPNFPPGPPPTQVPEPAGPAPSRP